MLALAGALLTAGHARADTVATDNVSYEGKVLGIKAGRLLLERRSDQLTFDLAKVTQIQIDGPEWTSFNAAEKLHADKTQQAALQASEAYKKSIPQINRPEMKLLAEWRAIEALDRNNDWLTAVQYFLDVYAAHPVDAAWQARPSTWPKAQSRALADSAARVEEALAATRSDDVRKNLRGFLLDIYTRSGNVEQAQKLARAMAAGTAVETAPAAPPPDTSAAADLEAALKEKDYAAVIAQADRRLPAATGALAARLYALKAQALEAQSKPAEAIAAWLRIPAHYPADPTAPAALLRAAQLDAQQKDAVGARALYDEILRAYPNSREAAIAGQSR